LVVPLLDTDDPDLQEAALRVVARHADWSGDVHGLVRAWLGEPSLGPSQQRALEGALLGFCAEPPVQGLMADGLTRAKAPASTRILLLPVLARCRLDGLPGPLAAAVAGALDDPDVSVRREAVATARLRKLAGLGGRLRRLALRPDLPDDLRIAALEAAAGG